MVWVGQDLPTDEPSLFETESMPRPMYNDIGDVNQFDDMCPFCLTTSARWRLIMRSEMCLSHEESSTFEAQCRDCSLYFLFGYGTGC